MPYQSVSASRRIEVLGRVSISLDCDPKRQKWGGLVRFWGKVTVGGTPPGVERELVLGYWDPDTGVYRELARGYCDGKTGDYGFEEYMSSDWACYKVEFAVKDVETGTLSNSVFVSVYYPTRISISAPSSVTKGKTFTVTGKLEYQRPDGWKPLGGRTVTVYWNGNVFGSGRTDSVGVYSISGKIDQVGTFTLKAVYGGEGFFQPARAVLELIRGRPRLAHAYLVP